MNKKVITILGDGNSIHLFGYIQNAIDFTLYKIILLTPEIRNDKYNSVYIEKGVKIINYHKNIPGYISKNKIFRRVNVILNILTNMRLEKSDFIHVHFANIEQCIIARILTKKNSKLIISFWGSDLLRANNKTKKIVHKCLKKSHKITLLTEVMLDKFQETYLNKFNDKILITKFGDQIFDYIKEIEDYYTKEDCKKYFDINQNKVSIAIGYNGIKEQQHLLVLEQIAKLNEETKEKMTLLLQMGNASKDYFVSVKNILDHIQCDYRIITDYLTEKDVAILRKSADIFINAQITDALSGSMQEYIYAGALVINGEWLNYKELEANNIRCLTFSSFDEIQTILLNMIDKKAEKNDDFVKKLDNISSWKAAKQTWRGLYV